MVLYVINLLNKLKKIKPTSFFIVASVFFEIILNIATPPLQAPDEINHFYKAFQIAEGHFLPDTLNKRVGGAHPDCLNEFVIPYVDLAFNLDYSIQHWVLLNSFDVAFNEKDKHFHDFANTAYNSPLSYLPQAVAIFCLKKLGFSMGTIYYGGRLLIFISWLLCMFFVIKLLPIYKWFFTTIILLPMNLYLANSYSADTMTLCVSFLFIAFILKIAFSSEQFKLKHLLVIVLFALAFILVKVVYVGLIGLVFVIPASKFKNKSSWVLSIVIVFSFAAVFLFLWTSAIMAYYISYFDYNQEYRNFACFSGCADYFAQKDYILNNGFYFFKVVCNSIVAHPSIYLAGYIGVFGNSDIVMSSWVTVVAYLGLFLILFSESAAFKFSVYQKTIFLLSGFAAFVLLLLSQHLIWDCVGESTVDMIQGRYLVPILPLVFLVIASLGFKVKLNTPSIVVPFIILINMYACILIYQRFFVDSYGEKTEFYCDVEELDSYGFIKTTTPNVTLDGAKNQSSKEHRSGKFSACVCAETPYGLIYNFKNLDFGDIVEVDVWRKGNAGNIVLSGGGKNCKDFNFGNNVAEYTAKNGWTRMHLLLYMKESCRNSTASFYVFNPGPTKTYFDDLKFSIRKKKTK